MGTQFAIVGLGNPGRDYGNTRHNLGYEVVSLLAERYGVSFTGGKGEYLVASGRFREQPVILAKPTTFMNESGFAIQGLVSFYKIEMERLLIVLDDVNMPLGRLRLKSGGSSGGHKGLDNIIYQLGRDDFPRLRIGIGSEHMPRDLRGYVLAPFRKDELPVVEEAVATAAEAVEMFMEHDIEEAMNRFN